MSKFKPNWPFRIGTPLVFVSILYALGFQVLADGSSEAEVVSKPDPAPALPTNGLVPVDLVRLGESALASKYALVVDKANRTLTIWNQEEGQIRLVKAVPADLGRNNGDKAASGDHRTPEGIYFPQEIKERNELNFDEYGVRAFTLDYPNFFDILDRKSGHGIWLHAIPDHKSLWRGSRGCVVVRNSTIMDISKYITLKRTPVLIQDVVSFAPAPVVKASQEQWKSWLEGWRRSWQEKNIDSYIQHYSDEFKSLGMNVKQWRAFKEGLNAKYSYIKVEANDPVFLMHKDRMVVRFTQAYESNQNADFGEKTIYLKKFGDSYKIIGEEWQPLNRDSVVATH